MSEDEFDIIDWLAEKYAGPVATRALWLWAGGRVEDVEYFDTPLEQWQMLWRKAEEGGKAEDGRRGEAGASVTIEFLLREMIKDFPEETRVRTFLRDYLKQ